MMFDMRDEDVDGVDVAAAYRINTLPCNPRADFECDRFKPSGASC